MRTAFSDSPTHFDMTSGPLIEMKFASDSVATAFARRVLPDPGGPYSRMPRRADAHALECLRVLQRHLDGLAQFHLDFL